MGFVGSGSGGFGIGFGIVFVFAWMGYRITGDTCGLLYILCIDKHTQKSIKSYT